MTEGYQYSQLSPSRSPSGPTYTQLSSGARTPATQQYHAVTTVPNNPGKNFPSVTAAFFSLHSLRSHEKLSFILRFPGMWGWQSQQHQTPQSDGQAGAQVATQAQPPHPGQTGPGTQPPQELSDMLQMLQEQGGSSGFEELNMFTTTFE